MKDRGLNRTLARLRQVRTSLVETAQKIRGGRWLRARIRQSTFAIIIGIAMGKSVGSVGERRRVGADKERGLWTTRRGAVKVGRVCDWLGLNCTQFAGTLWWA